MAPFFNHLCCSLSVILLIGWQNQGLALPQTHTAYSVNAPAVPFTTIAPDDCLPAFAVGCSYGNGTGLNSLTVNGTALSTSSGCSPSGYSQFTATTAAVSPGRSYSFAGTLLNSATPAGFGIWADVNRNGSFDSEEVVFSPGQPVTGGFTGAFLIPATLTPGPLALRIVLVANAYPNSASACGSFYAGEAEDYWLNVVPATGCALPTITLSGSTTIAPGVATPLAVLLTGNQPISFTVGNNGTAQQNSITGGSLAYYNIPANPTITTVYFPLSVSNACGVGTASGSATVVVQNCEPPTGLFETEKTLSSVRLNWQPLAVASNYTVGFREAGTSSFTYYSTYSNISSYSLYSLTYGKAYEWQVNTVCTNGSSTSYSAPRSFTMSCPEPFSLTEVTSGASSVYLQWAYVGYPINFTVQYRVADTSPWTSATGLTSTTYYPTGWEAGQRYEWRVRTDCANGNSTDFSPSRFITVPCNAPTNLTINALTGSTAQLSWGYNYNIQYELQWRRQQPANSPYSSATVLTSSYSLTGLTAGIGYEYRVRTVCSASATSAFTAPYSFTPQCGAVNYQSANTITSSGAVLQWGSPTYTSTYNLIYRVAGAPVSTTVSALTGTTFSLTGLANSTVYEFQVQVICTDGSLSGFSTPFSFTTQCTIPANLYGYAGSNSATLDWSSYGSDTRYELIYRPIGSPVSATVTSLSSSGSYVYYTLTGLSTSTAYEWQVRTVCADGNRSAFTAPQPFTTTACQIPYSAYENHVISTAAQVTWSSITGLQYTVRWRLAGASVWSASATVPASVTVSNTVYLIAGLTNNTAYEWQVGTLCPDGTQSGFTAVHSFITNCPVTTYTSVSDISPTNASVYWSNNTNLNYMVRWRPANSVTTPWTESSTLAIGVSNYSLTGLTGGTTYEVQVGTICGSGIVSYSNSVTFVAQCQPPVNFYASAITDRTTLLTFSAGYSLPGLRYDVQYQLQGSTGWTLVSNISSTTLLLTSLSAATGYSWQVRTICLDGTYSAFSALQSFTTRTACPAMYTIHDGYWSDYSIWSCGFVPSSAHDVEIRHVITLSGSYPNQARKVGYAVGGKLVYLPGAKLQLGQ